MERGTKNAHEVAEFDLRTRYMEKGTVTSLILMKGEMQEIMVPVEAREFFFFNSME